MRFVIFLIGLALDLLSSASHAAGLSRQDVLSAPPSLLIASGARHSDQTSNDVRVEKAARDILTLQQEYRMGKTLSGIDKHDLRLLQFGLIRPVSPISAPDFYNPHATVVYATAQCVAGRTVKLISKMSHVEGKDDLGAALSHFVEVFGPDLERYRGKALAVKFVGYRLRESTSVWYYSLTDAKGNSLPGNPWLSLHRSRSTGRSALTGIFLPAGSKDSPSMPNDLVIR